MAQLGAVSTREIDGKATEFGTAGYTLDNVFVLYDRASNSVWYPGDDATLQAVGGARRGQSLPFRDEPAPMPLAAWIEMHPGSTVLLPSEADVRELNRPYLGVGLEDRDGGLTITQVADGSPAAAAGLRAGDVLRQFHGRGVGNRDDLRAILADLRPGVVVELLVARDGAEREISLTLGSPP